MAQWMRTDGTVQDVYPADGVAFTGAELSFLLYGDSSLDEGYTGIVLADELGMFEGVLLVGIGQRKKRKALNEVAMVFLYRYEPGYLVGQHPGQGPYQIYGDVLAASYIEADY